MMGAHHGAHAPNAPCECEDAQLERSGASRSARHGAQHRAGSGAADSTTAVPAPRERYGWVRPRHGPRLALEDYAPRVSAPERCIFNITTLRKKNTTLT